MTTLTITEVQAETFPARFLMRGQKFHHAHYPEISISVTQQAHRAWDEALRTTRIRVYTTIGVLWFNFNSTVVLEGAL